MSLQVQTQTLQINNVPVSKLQDLRERARKSGTSLEEYALRLIVEGLEAHAQSHAELATPPRVLTEWYGRLEDAAQFPDLAYWLAQPDAAKFDDAWEMVIEAHQIKGEDIRESRLQRTVGGLQHRAG